MSEESIHDLWHKLEAHPDFAGGAYWSREDVAHSLYQLEDEDFGYLHDDLPPERIAAVTDEEMKWARDILSSYIFNDHYTWNEALQDGIVGQRQHQEALKKFEESKRAR